MGTYSNVCHMQANKRLPLLVGNALTIIPSQVFLVTESLPYYHFIIAHRTSFIDVRSVLTHRAYGVKHICDIGI